MKRLLLVVGPLIALGLASGCAVPGPASSPPPSYSHLDYSGQGQTYYPHPGYVWTNLDQNGKPIPGNMAVHWSPGIGYTSLGSVKWPHLESSAIEGKWFPRPGYSWDQHDAAGAPPPGQLGVHWEPGKGFYSCGTLKWPHLVSAPTEGKWIPEPGYSWDQHDAAGHPVQGQLGVHWEPGRGFHDGKILKWPHIVSGPTEGNWFPEPGYGWVQHDAAGAPPPGQLAVHWVPGKEFKSCGTLKWPHVMAGPTEGNWYPEPGYTWAKVDSNGSPTPGELAVHWTPGHGYESGGSVQWPHVVAASEVERWRPAPGYAWTHLDSNGKPIPGDLAVHWVEGRTNPDYPHVLSAAEEDTWIAAQGYRWAHLDEKGKPIPGDFAVIPVEPERLSALNEHWVQYLKEIEDEHDFGNWSEPPYTKYTSGKRVY